MCILYCAEVVVQLYMMQTLFKKNSSSQWIDCTLGHIKFQLITFLTTCLFIKLLKWLVYCKPKDIVALLYKFT